MELKFALQYLDDTLAGQGIVGTRFSHSLVNQYMQDVITQVCPCISITFTNVHSLVKGDDH